MKHHKEEFYHDEDLLIRLFILQHADSDLCLEQLVKKLEREHDIKMRNITYKYRCEEMGVKVKITERKSTQKPTPKYIGIYDEWLQNKADLRREAEEGSG